VSSASGSAGVFTTDRALVVRSWDAWLAEATGLAEGDATGRPLVELFPELDARRLLARLQRVADTGAVEVLAPALHAYLIPCPPRAPSAHFARMQQHVTVAPLGGGDGIVGVVVTIEDVTARRERERELAAQLQSPDDAVRLRAVRALEAEAGSAGSLAGALGDPSWRVRKAAAEGLARGPDEDAMDELLAALRERHRDPAVLNAALTALVRARHDVVAPLVALLAAADSDTDLRTYVALALGLLGDRRGVAALVRTLGDPDANVRFHAIEALGRIGSREAALPVLEVAESRDFSVAFAALDTLALIGEPSVARRLVPLLDDELLRPAAVDALGRLGGEDVAGVLARLLAAPDGSAADVATALATLHARFHERGEGDRVAELTAAVATPDGGRALIAALATGSDAERAAIAVVLGWLDVAGTEAALARLLTHPGARRAAADVLARRGVAAVAPLLDALAADDAEARKAAAAALGRIGAAAAVPALVALLDESPEVAVVAAGALGSIGDARAFEPLLARLDDSNAAVRQAAVSAIHSIGHPDTPTRIHALLDHPSPHVREAAAKIAGYFGYEACVDPLLALCHDADEGVRRAAVEQLAHLVDPRVHAALAEALDGGTPGVRAAAVRALAHVDAAESLPRLLAACRDADPWVRYYAARSLGRHRRAGAVTSLIALATGDPIPPVRIAAVEALGEIGAADGMAALLPLADDADPMIARPALAALGQSADPATLAPLVAALSADDAGLRLAALEALARRADPTAAVAVAELAQRGRDPEERRRALAVLAGTGGADAVAALVGIAAEPAHTAAVVDALATLDGRQLPWVARGLALPDVHVRCALIEALGRMGHGAAAPLLAGALHDPEPAVRVAAAHALERLDLRDARASATDTTESRA
jgi:HEAT repeat protein